jgi:hypothetical protein
MEHICVYKVNIFKDHSVLQNCIHELAKCQVIIKLNFKYVTATHRVRTIPLQHLIPDTIIPRQCHTDTRCDVIKTKFSMSLRYILYVESACL